MLSLSRGKRLNPPNKARSGLVQRASILEPTTLILFGSALIAIPFYPQAANTNR